MASSYIPAHVGDEAVEAFYLVFVDLSAGRGIWQIPWRRSGCGSLDS